MIPRRPSHSKKINSGIETKISNIEEKVNHKKNVFYTLLDV